MHKILALLIVAIINVFLSAISVLAEEAPIPHTRPVSFESSPGVSIDKMLEILVGEATEIVYEFPGGSIDPLPIAVRQTGGVMIFIKPHYGYDAQEDIPGWPRIVVTSKVYHQMFDFPIPHRGDILAMVPCGKMAEYQHLFRQYNPLSSNRISNDPDSIEKSRYINVFGMETCD